MKDFFLHFHVSSMKYFLLLRQLVQQKQFDCVPIVNEIEHTTHGHSTKSFIYQ